MALRKDVSCAALLSLLRMVAMGWVQPNPCYLFLLLFALILFLLVSWFCGVPPADVDVAGFFLLLLRVWMCLTMVRCWRLRRSAQRLTCTILRVAPATWKSNHRVHLERLGSATCLVVVVDRLGFCVCSVFGLLSDMTHG